MVQVPINYWAVLVSAIVCMVLGFIYYGPLFGKLYSRLMGFDTLSPEQRQALMKGMNKGYTLTFIGALVMSFVLAHAVIYAGSFMHWSGLSAGLITGFMSWIGFIAPVTMGNVIFGRQPWKLWFLSNTYQLLQLLIIGAILGTWK